MNEITGFVFGYVVRASDAIYPWVSWVYIEWYWLFALFFVMTFAVRIGDRITGNLYLVGITFDQIKTATKENGDVRPPFASLSVLDSPTKDLVLRRRFHYYLRKVIRSYYLVLWLGAFAIVIESMGEELADPRHISLGQWYLLSADHNYGLFWIVAGIVLAFAAARLVQFAIMTDWFGAEDLKVIDTLAKSRKKSSQRSGELTDVRTLDYGARVTFDPTTYFGQAKARDAVFLGLDSKQDEIWVDRAIWRKTNIQILGVPGSGKSVMATNALVQCAASFGDAVVYFDPKNDSFAPHVFRKHCPDFTLIDLRQGKPAQLNLFQGLNQYDMLNLLIAGFNLAEAGEAADFYRVSEQKAAKFIARQFPNGANVQQLLQAAYALPKELKDDAKGLLNKLENLADLSVLQTDNGVDIERIINRGGCLYVIGSMDDESVIRLQKMLFARCVQIVNARDELREYAHVNLMIDEIKYLLSKYVLNALGTVRSKDCHILLAHQSLGDFGQCGQDLNPEFVRTSVIDNTPVRWFYRASNYESAVWASEQTGEILVDVERSWVKNERGSVEVVGHDRQLQKEKRYLFDTNMIQHMPDGFAVVTGLGTAKQAFTHPIVIERTAIPLYECQPLAPVDDFGEFLPTDEYYDLLTQENAPEARTEARNTDFEGIY